MFCKLRQHERGLVDVAAIVLERPEVRGGLISKLLLWLPECVLALGADHEAYLSARVSWYRTIGVADRSGREDLLAKLVKLLDDVHVQPDALGLSANDASVAQSAVNQIKERLLEQ